MPPKKKNAPAKAEPQKGGTRGSRALALKDWVDSKMKGHAQLKLASEYVLPFMTKRFPTGLTQLDVALGGGFPAGGVSQIVGPKNSCKTYLAWQTVRQQQFYKGGDLSVLLAQTEMRADRTQARRAGVVISLGDDDIIALEKARIEQGMAKFTKEELVDLKREVGTIHEVHGTSAEKLFDVILKAVADNAYHLIILDSFGSIMSAAENEVKSLDEKTYAGASGPISQFLKHLTSLLTMDDGEGNVRDVAIIGINQIRDAIGDPNLEYRSPGGRALEHAKFVDLLLTSGGQVGYHADLYTTTGAKKRWVQTGKEVSWQIVKGKAGIHEGARGSFNFDFNTASGDFYQDTLVAGVNAKVIQQNGAWFGIPNPTDPSKNLLYAQGKEKFLAALVEDAAKCAAEDSSDSLMNHVRNEVFKKHNIFINYDWA